MTLEVHIDPNVDAIAVPENLRIGLMVAEQRRQCRDQGCGFDYAGFAFGQSPFHVPPSLERALAMHTNKGHYTEATGIPELREAIAGFNKRHFGLDVDPSRIVVGPGTKDLIFTVLTMVSGHAIIPSPSWIGYLPQLKLLGKHYHLLWLREEDDYKITAGQLEDYLAGLAPEGRQHLLILNNPHNPTGALYTKDDLVDIADVCRKHDTLVLSDEIYALSTFNFDDFTSMGLIYPEGTFITNGLSKDRSAAGYRFGSCILPLQDSERLIRDFTKIAATVYTNVNTPTQYAAITAYEPNPEIDEYLEITRDIHRIMGLAMWRAFNGVDGIKATKPKGAFYFFADFNALAPDLKRKGIMSSNDLGHALLNHPFHVATITGDAVLLRPENYGARIAYVDYDGKQAFDDYRNNPPKTEAEEDSFLKANAPTMVKGVEWLQDFVNYIKE